VSISFSVKIDIGVLCLLFVMSGGFGVESYNEDLRMWGKLIVRDFMKEDFGINREVERKCILYNYYIQTGEKRKNILWSSYFVTPF